MKACVALFLCALVLSGQTSSRPAKSVKPKRSEPAPAATVAGPIRSIGVDGANHLSPEQVVALAGLRIGQVASRTVFEAARDRILQSGCIETFGWKYTPTADGSGYDVRLEITEPDQMLPWGIERLPVTAEELAPRAQREIACFGKDIPTYDTYLDKVIAVLKKMLAEKVASGKAPAAITQEKIVAKVTANLKGEPRVMFQPATPPPVIADVQFHGNKVIPSPVLHKAMSDVAVGVPFTDEMIRQLIDNQVRPMYEAIGHLTVKFPTIAHEPAKNVQGVVVMVTVDEGPLYTLDTVEIRGTPLDREALDTLAPFKKGTTASYSEVGKGIDKVFAQLKNKGYLKPEYKASRQLNEKDHTAKIFVDVNPGPQYHFSKLTIEGLDILTEPAIRELWGLKMGDPFRVDYPNFFLEQVRQRGILDNLGETKASTKIDEETKNVDVTLVFKAPPLDPDAKRRPRKP